MKGGDGSGGIVEERRPCLSVPLMCSWCCSYNKETKKQRYFTKRYKKRLSFQTEITVCLQEGTIWSLTTQPSGDETIFGPSRGQGKEPVYVFSPGLCLVFQQLLWKLWDPPPLRSVFPRAVILSFLPSHGICSLPRASYGYCDIHF